MIPAKLIAAVAPFFTGIFLAWLLFCLIREVLPQVSTAGERGVQRQTARRQVLWFPLVEPALRTIAHAIKDLPATPVRAVLSRRIGLAGNPFGLTPDELLASVLMLSTCLGVVGSFISRAVVSSPGPGIVLGAILGAALPWFRLDEVARKRVRTICRSLPQAIDLVALAMHAGLDFPGAIRQVARRMPESSPLRFELEHLLHKLSIGHSRHLALAGLARRVPAPPIRQFVSAVTQAERQGTPLAKILGVQARVMRVRRSQAAEQAAARAAVLILGPLMLIFSCVFIVLLGPFAIKAMRGELF